MEPGKSNYPAETGPPQKSNGQDDSHPHRHGVVDPAIISTRIGMRAVKWSMVGPPATALVQLIVVYFSGSVALFAEIHIAVGPELSVKEAHEIAEKARHRLLHHLTYLSHALIHVAPARGSGESHHRVESHAHDELPPHSHQISQAPLIKWPAKD